MVGDITYVWTAEGWLYWACCWICIPQSVGWALSGEGAALVQKALKMAWVVFFFRQPEAVEPFFGSRDQYACGAYQPCSQAYGIRCVGVAG